MMMIARHRGRRAIQEDLGAFRSFSSFAHHQLSAVDEEELFAEIALQYLKGIRSEIAKLFGPTKARKLLDPFAK